MTLLSSIIRWLLVAITLLCGLVIVPVACVAYLYKQYTAVPTTRTFVKNYNHVHFDMHLNQLKENK